ncbi:hypothetical protein AVEN_76889-1, partial [Araneus ventricosus]
LRRTVLSHGDFCLENLLSNKFEGLPVSTLQPPTSEEQDTIRESIWFLVSLIPAFTVLSLLAYFYQIISEKFPCLSCFAESQSYQAITTSGLEGNTSEDGEAETSLCNTVNHRPFQETVSVSSMMTNL